MPSTFVIRSVQACQNKNADPLKIVADVMSWSKSSNVMARREGSRRAALVGGFVAVVVVVVIGAGVCSGAASADTGHEFLARVSEAPVGSLLSEPMAVAADHSDGEWFVGDAGTGVVDVFNAAGGYLTQFGEGLEASGVAVDEANGDVYVSTGQRVDVFGPDGKGGYELLSAWTGADTPNGEFSEAVGVAVDNSASASDPHAGDVYVVDGGNNVVNAFKPGSSGAGGEGEGAFVGALTGHKLEEPNGVAVDAATGEVYVADSATGAVDVYSPSGVYERRINGLGSPGGRFGASGAEGNVRAVAVEEATGDVYVAEAERHAISQFSSAGEWLGWITGTTSGGLIEPDGLAVAGDGDAYVADAGAEAVDVFGPGVLVAGARTTAASKVGKTGAVLNGVVNGEGLPVKYRFEWGVTEAYGASTAWVEAAGTGEEKIDAPLAGLSPDTVYHYRLVTEDANGVNVGADREFRTLPAVEALSTGTATAVTPTSAILTGSLTPAGVDVHWWFEWGTGAGYGEKTPSTDAGAGAEAVAAQAELADLRPNTTYRYRLVGSDQYGVTSGEEKRFTTSGPPRITGEPVTSLGHEAATLNAKVDPDKLETSYRFEYGETTAYGSEAPAGGGSLAAGEAQAPVTAALSGLRMASTYHYRIVASNSAGTTIGPDHTFETVPAAVIEDTAATGVHPSEATIEAQIDPLGHETTVYFQYGSGPCKSEPASCTSAPAPPGEDIGSGETLVSRTEQLTGLQPASTYHYRVIAINGLGASEGPELTFTTPPAEAPFALPDGRAWEMVTPPNKHGAPVEALTAEGGLILAAEDGDSLAYVADGPVAEEAQGNRSPEMQQVVATRGPAGWSSEDLATPSSKAEGTSASNPPEYQFFTPELSEALVEPWSTGALSEPPLAPEARQRTMYIRDNATGTYLPLVTEANVPAGTEFGDKIHFLTATPDLAHVLLRSEVALTGSPAGKGLYEWSNGALQFVSLLPSGAPAGEAELGFDGHMLASAVSGDGTRVIWTSKDENGGAGHLYMRDTATGQTIQLDAAEGVGEPATGSAQFQTASANGSKVFFTDKQQLTPNSVADPEFPGQADLYECEMVEREGGQLACDLKDLTAETSQGEPANVQGLLLGASENGERVFLVAKGVLAENENGDGELAEAGQDNLYALSETASGWQTAFVGALSPEDSHEWEGNKQADSAFLTARVSPNGRYLAFMSAASLTGYDNADVSPAAHGARDEEVYLYDAQTASLRCVSCNPTGARPTGVFEPIGAANHVDGGEGVGLVVDRREIWRGHWLAGSIPGWTAQSLVSALFQSRYLDNEGRLFFDSADALVPQVTTPTRAETIEGQSQQVGVENVYEYEPADVGSCQSPSGGCVSLISSGASDRESAFLEATPSGDDVFFLTDAQLLPQDTDTAFDIYDARVCSAQSPCLTPPSPPSPGCDGADACRPAEPAQQAPVSNSGTASFSGPGNSSTAKSGVLPLKTAKPKPPTRAQQLAKALATCHRRYPHARRKRAKCEAQARDRYSVKHDDKIRSHRRSSSSDSSKRGKR